MTVLTCSERTVRKRGEHLGLAYMSAFCYVVISDVLVKVFSYYHGLGSDWCFSCEIWLLL